VSGRLQVPAALPREKSPWHPLDRKLGGPQSPFGRGGEEEKFHLCAIIIIIIINIIIIIIIIIIQDGSVV
jgi:hypothetical protein